MIFTPILVILNLYVIISLIITIIVKVITHLLYIAEGLRFRHVWKIAVYSMTPFILQIIVSFVYQVFDSFEYVFHFVNILFYVYVLVLIVIGIRER